jgi:hypothetical protein
MTGKIDHRPVKLSVDSDFFDLLTGSYARIVGKPLIESGRDAEWLYNDAPFVVVAHNTDPDPRVIYAGRRFWMEDGLVWELVDKDGNRHGQAATFSLWKDS